MPSNGRGRQGFLVLRKSERILLDLMVECKFSKKAAADQTGISLQVACNYLRAARVRNKVREERRLVFIHRMNMAGYEVISFDSGWDSDPLPVDVGLIDITRDMVVRWHMELYQGASLSLGAVASIVNKGRRDRTKLSSEKLARLFRAHGLPVSQSTARREWVPEGG